MAEARQIEVNIVGASVKGVVRTLNLMRGQPGRIAVTVYAGTKPNTVVVSAEELRTALGRLYPDAAAQRDINLPNGSA
jgi:hypothetical protein